MGIAADENVQSESVGFSITGGAIGMAIDLLNARQMINGYTFDLGIAATQVLEEYDFNQIAILYTTNDVQYCDGVIDDFEYAVNGGDNNINIVYKQRLPLDDNITFTNILLSSKQRARGMATEEYVYILLSARALGFVSSGLSPFWEQTDGNVTSINEDAKKAAARFLVIDISTAILDPDYYEYFMDHSMTRIREWPIYCTTSLCMNNTNKTVPGYARNLHDVVYLYGIALNNTVDPNEVKRPDIMQQRMQTTFDGLTGQVTITENNSRDAIFLMYTLNEAYDEVAYANISFQGDTAMFTPLYVDESDLWKTRGGRRPLSIPLCGFLGSSCPKEFWDEYLVYVVIALAFVGYAFRQKQMELQREKDEWQIPFIKLQKPPTKVCFF
ncbi:hypothetical protein WR25_16470 [Diploscapter pachys]|uniref:Receptor ligand binding region domain-containing protein n=1 Tax=Diploscapter pachys TaxID=2018661 RepID=A0A2A2LI68_9BILA|nr:hypothetical protein WR25_16470 [Diploscapter pachys]